ncbi:MAG: peptidoglycan-binding protein [Gammaproteobacteria bacterium]|nr:peptidoglycan-binding protein [Gammaproteobacteria bacterium]MDH4313615.1 peptidoglycan-binding protein [Gammaproteobacteria bacterium]MDH5213334.1 peptidoglycan-binding protein [Gammaproteobacteria bacterium]
MHIQHLCTKLLSILLLSSLFAASSFADDITQRIQRDLVTLGYDPGNVDGESSDATIAAIAQFQAERNLAVTGEASPLLAGIISAEVSKAASATTSAENPPAMPSPAQDPAAVQAAQQACLQEKMNAAQASNKKKRGFGRLLSAVTRSAAQSGNYDLARTTGDIYSASATADDLSAAAKDLGLTEDEIAECRNPT